MAEGVAGTLLHA